MSYSPVPGRDIRTTYDPVSGMFLIQQERTRGPNGSTDPNDLGGILDLYETGWETRYHTDDVVSLLSEVFNLAYSENVVCREVDLGPLNILSPVVVGALSRLQLLTY